MEDLIAALQIFLKYSKASYPILCEHDELRVCVSPKEVSTQDKQQLERLGFDEDLELDNFVSTKYGSC